MVEAKKQPLILWQLPMKRVLYALGPAVLASIWFFGWRSMVVLAVVTATAFLTEFLFVRARKEPVSSAVFVTAFLLALSLPPGIPYWMAAVGAVFAIIFGKMVFGGYGRNVFNPALTGRVFLYVTFALPLTARWVQPLVSTVGPLHLPGSWGGFTRFAADAVSAATPLALLRDGRPVELFTLLWGNVSGSLGETSAVLLALGGIYILVTRAANWRIVVSELAAFLAMQTALWLARVPHASDPLSALLAGSLLLGMLFMSTDPISAAQTQAGRWIYGALIGVLTVLIRTFSIWPEATGFAILLGNTFAGIIDYFVRQSREKAKAQAAPPSER
jgi:Na+-transporting NADH:ubiquinone oxidoreductase subunit B